MAIHLPYVSWYEGGRGELCLGGGVITKSATAHVGYCSLSISLRADEKHYFITPTLQSGC